MGLRLEIQRTVDNRDPALRIEQLEAMVELLRERIRVLEKGGRDGRAYVDVRHQ